jgi:hypothetical protein
MNFFADFLRDAEKNKLPHSDHQVAVIGKTKQLQRQCSRLASSSIQKEDKIEPVTSQVSTD